MEDSHGFWRRYRAVYILEPQANEVLQTTFKGRVFMTHATKAIYRWLLSDYIKVRWVCMYSHFEILYNLCLLLQ